MNRDDIIRMAEESGLHIFGLGLDRKKFYFFVEQFFDMAQAAEREACAEICQQQSELQLDERVMRGIDVCKDAIRARGKA